MASIPDRMGIELFFFVAIMITSAGLAIRARVKHFYVAWDRLWDGTVPLLDNQVSSCS